MYLVSLSSQKLSQPFHLLFDNFSPSNSGPLSGLQHCSCIPRISFLIWCCTFIAYFTISLKMYLRGPNLHSLVSPGMLSTLNPKHDAPKNGMGEGLEGIYRVWLHFFDHADHLLFGFSLWKQVIWVTWKKEMICVWLLKAH